MKVKKKQKKSLSVPEKCWEKFFVDFFDIIMELLFVYG